MKAALYAPLILPLLFAQETGADFISGNARYEGCKQLVNREMNRKLFEMGACAGALIMLWEIRAELPENFEFCPPADAQVGDAFEIVAYYLNQHRPQLQEKFLDLARSALTDAWPCER